MAGVLDQYQTTSHEDVPAPEIFSTRYSGQTFIPSFSGNLLEVHLWLLKYGTPENLIVEIRETSGGLPTATILASQEIAQTSVPSDSELTVTFDTPATLSSSTVYCIVIHQKSDGGEHLTSYYPQGSTMGYYANGDAVGKLTTTWTNWHPNDLWFKTYMSTPSTQKTILSDAKIQLIAAKKTILSNAQVTHSILKTILSNAQIRTSGTKKIIYSNATIYGPLVTLYNINNKINTVIRTLSNINNKVNTVFRTLSDINNVISFVKSVVSDINNKVNTQKRMLYNITNDIRFIKSWQVPGVAGVQSRGKAYITLTIASVTQTDVDVDSITINKTIGQPFVATFELGRAYDSTKPSLESKVIIKYDEWELFKGYISSITPTDSPESMRIECKNKQWLDDRTNVYFKVGHKPGNNKEKYYETIYDAIVGGYSLVLPFGNFIPETIDCFSQGKASTLVELCEESGNYSCFYDENENVVVWVAGNGAIIELNRQVLGENLNLYHVLEHRFTETAENIVNKFRVQMGAKAIDTKNKITNYTGYDYQHFFPHAAPTWNSYYELLQSQTGSGYGWDYRDPNNESNYKDVFKKYSFSAGGLIAGLQSFSDLATDKPFIVRISNPNGLYTPNFEEGEMTEGFSIDWENQIIIFNEAKYSSYKVNGKLLSIRAPSVSVDFYNKQKWTVTLTPTDNPETTPGNDLMFITAKIGSYANTIIKDLDLSSLTIQEEETINGVTHLGWDDTDYAEDYALWQLSKTSEKKINGTVSVTLDTVCYYGIDLAKRIFVSGITESNMNVVSLSYNISKFTVDIEVENLTGYTRAISLPARGE